MKKKLALLLSLILVVTLFSACGSNDDSDETADSGSGTAADVVVKGNVYTADGEDSVVEAFAVKDGEIVYVGDEAGVAELEGEGTEVIETGDEGIAMPGFVEGHGHGSNGGVGNLYEVNLYEDASIEEYQSTIQEFIDEHGDMDFILGSGWINGYFPDGTPTADLLDEISDEVPIVMISEDHHSYWVNTAALELAGVDASTEDVPGGVIERDGEGNPSGTFRENASSVIEDIIPEYTVDQYKEGILEYQEESLEYGITSYFEAIVSGNLLEAYNELDNDGELLVRVYGAYPVNALEDLDAAQEAMDNASNDMFTLETIKIFADGVIEGHTAYLLEDYSDAAGDRGEPLWEQDAMNETFARAEEMGMQIHTHAIGDAAVKMTIDAHAYANEQNGDTELRHGITHVQLVDQADFARMGELNLIAATNPYWAFKEPGYFDEVEIPYIGEERANSQYPMKSFFDNGVIVNVASDYPVTIPAMPLDAIQIGATRMNVEADEATLQNPDEIVTVLQMMKAATYNGAYSYFDEDARGSIEEGKSGDFIILDKNIMEIDPTEVASTQVLSTYFHGAIAYENEQ